MPKGRCGKMRSSPLTASIKQWLAKACFGSIVGRPIHGFDTNVGCGVNGFKPIWRNIWRDPSFSSSIGSCTCVVCSTSEFPMVGVSVRCTVALCMVTGWECHGKTSRLAGKIPYIKRFIKTKPGTLSTAKFGAISNHILVIRFRVGDEL